MTPFVDIAFLILSFFTTISLGWDGTDYHSASASKNGIMNTIVSKPTDGGIREDIPAKFRDRYAKWKEELLSTDFGRQQWESYANNKNFILTITMSNKRGQGAGTDPRS